MLGGILSGMENVSEDERTVRGGGVRDRNEMKRDD